MSNGYIHGDGLDERERLRRQAPILASKVHPRLPFGTCRRLLEVGCGVGAQSEILLQSFPRVHLVGIDANPAQVEAARQRVGSAFRGRAEFLVTDASALELHTGTFDGAFCCWVLEHVGEPARVLAEVRRVLEPGAPVACCEVLNASLFVHPESEALRRYWQAYNEHQVALGGDPFVGAKLGYLLLAAGFRDVTTEVQTFFFDERAPGDRKTMIDYFTELLRSAAPGLLAAERVSPGVVNVVTRDLAAAGRAQDGVFFYSFIRAFARA
jgi:ubiquinone/menaquinone biosynthesis C-methylase UbiE